MNSLLIRHNFYVKDRLIDTFNRSSVDCVSIATSDDYVKSLMGLFNKRG